MKTGVAKIPSISVADYLEGEQYAQFRHEYIDGKVYAMGGASDKHGLIAANVGALLNTRLPDSCQVFIADMKVHLQIQSQDIFYYPDVLVSCSRDDQATYYREQPVLIVEVLSPSTARQDRYEKFGNYQTITSLQEYLLIEQDYRLVEIFRRSRQWEREVFTEGAFRLDSVDQKLTFDEVYRRVTWGSPLSTDNP